MKSLMVAFRVSNRASSAWASAREAPGAYRAGAAVAFWGLAGAGTAREAARARVRITRR